MAVIVRAEWRRTQGSLVLLGPTGIGKSRILPAIGLRILDAAHRGNVDEDGLRFASGVRLVTGLDLGKATEQQKLGTGSEPEIARMAKRASLLLIDEAGYERNRFDPNAIRDIVYARYEAGKPTHLSSGMTAAQIEAHYDVPMMRKLWERGTGQLIDLHTRTS